MANENEEKRSEDQKAPEGEQNKQSELDSLLEEVTGMFAKDDPFPISTGESPKEENEEDEEGEDPEVPSNEEAEEEEEGTKGTEKDSEISSLKAELAELKALIKEGKVEKEDKEEKKPEPPKRLLTLSDEEYDEVLSDKEKFENLFSNSHELVKAEILKILPGLVTNLVTSTTTTQNAVDSFKKNNDDIFSHGVSNKEEKDMRTNFIRTVASQIESTNPSLSIEEVLQKTAETVRKTLNISKEDVKKKTEKDSKQEKRSEAKKAAFVKSVGTTAKKEEGELTDLQKEMAEMLRV